MNIDTYEKMDKFVNEMNESVTVVGDMSVYLFNRFRVFVGYLFISVTTIAIAFIVAEFIRGFELPPIYGIDVYYIALSTSIIIGAFLAYYGEEAKIATIKGSIFSAGSNRFWQLCAALVIIAVLILVNAKGVQKMADFSLRYMNVELENSVIYKLKEQKMQTHAELATLHNSVEEIGDGSIKALQRSRDDLVSAKKREIDAVQSAADNYINGRDPKAYRTLIANKRVETAKKIGQIEAKWAKKIAKIDWKISREEIKRNERLVASTKLRQLEMQKADAATDDLVGHYKTESQKNQALVAKYKNIGLIIAIGGEVIDGLLAFVLFMIVKSNPNVAGTPSIQRNTRPMASLHDNYHHTKPYQTKESQFQLKSKNEPLNSSLFQQIKEEAYKMASERNELLTFKGESYQKHPTQRALIKRFKQKGINITPLQIGQYIAKMENSLIFINQKVGFVYAQKVAAAA